MYCKFIFPKFHLLDKAAQLCQLRFIKENIYPQYKFLLEEWYANKPAVKQAKTFVKDLKFLECILDNNGVLRTIDSFYDYNEKLFKVFCQESDFLPNELRTAEWLDFLKYFDLKYAPTKTEFIAFCKMLSKYDLSILQLKLHLQHYLRHCFTYLP